MKHEVDEEASPTPGKVRRSRVLSRLFASGCCVPELLPRVHTQFWVQSRVTKCAHSFIDLGLLGFLGGSFVAVSLTQLSAEWA